MKILDYAASLVLFNSNFTRTREAGMKHSTMWKCKWSAKQAI
jgi:hypothetical protein